MKSDEDNCIARTIQVYRLFLLFRYTSILQVGNFKFLPRINHKKQNDFFQVAPRFRVIPRYVPKIEVLNKHILYMYYICKNTLIHFLNFIYIYFIFYETFVRRKFFKKYRF